MKILFLDDMPERIPLLRRREEVEYVRNGNEMVAWLKANGTPDVISFDHDLADEHYLIGYTSGGRENGADAARWCVENGFIPKIVIVHSWNADGAKNIAKHFEQFDCKIIVRPFNPKIPHMWEEGSLWQK